MQDAAQAGLDAREKALDEAKKSLEGKEQAAKAALDKYNNDMWTAAIEGEIARYEELGKDVAANEAREAAAVDALIAYYDSMIEAIG